MAGTIDELKALAEKREVKDGGPKATKLAHKMFTAGPRFEAGEEVSFSLTARALTIKLVLHKRSIIGLN